MGPYVAWGPYGQFINTCSEWNLTLCDLSQTTRILDPKQGIMTGSCLMACGDGGIADLQMALLSVPADLQTHLWKIAAALKPVMLFNGSFSGTAQSASNYSFTLFQKYNVTACVPFPYVFLVGKVTFGLGMSCPSCRLYSCLNTSVPLQPGDSTVFCSNEPTFGYPLNWARSGPRILLILLWWSFFTKLLKCTKHIIGVVLAVVLSLIAVATVATVSGMALHTSLQTKHFVEQWHKDSHKLWLAWTQIDTRLQTQINILKQTVNWLGKVGLVIERQIWLRCDWNSTTFCVTSLCNNDSEHDWQLIQQYLEGNRSASKFINTLNIKKVFGRQFEHDDVLALAEAFLKQLEGLDPRGLWQSLSHTAGGMGIVLLMLLLLLIILYFTCIRPTHSSLITLWKAVLFKKSKEKRRKLWRFGYCVIKCRDHATRAGGEVEYCLGI